MSDQTSVRCSECGQINNKTSGACWLCGAPFVEAITVEVVEAADVDSTGSSAILIVLALAVLFVLVGLFMEEPGGAIAMSILLAAPLARTAIVVGKRKHRGKATSAAGTFGLYLVSAAVTWILLTAATVAAFGAFCLACFGTMATNGDEQTMLAIAGCAALGAGGLVLYFFWSWIAKRYQRDITR